MTPTESSENVQGNKIGSCCRRTLIWIVVFFLCFASVCLPFFYFFWFGVCVRASACLCACLFFFFFSVLLLGLTSFRFFSMCFSLSSIAPHEICKDEHLLSMSWKRASAGETVYNKCPTNATGQSHCMLLANNALSSKKKTFCEIMSQQPKQWKKLFSKMKSKYYKTNRLR